MLNAKCQKFWTVPLTSESGGLFSISTVLVPIKNSQYLAYFLIVPVFSDNPGLGQTGCKRIKCVFSR